MNGGVSTVCCNCCFAILQRALGLCNQLGVLFIFFVHSFFYFFTNIKSLHRPKKVNKNCFFSSVKFWLTVSTMFESFFVCKCVIISFQSTRETASIKCFIWYHQVDARESQFWPPRSVQGSWLKVCLLPDPTVDWQWWGGVIGACCWL